MQLETLTRTQQELSRAAENLNSLTQDELEGMERLINADWAETLSVHASLSEELPPTHDYISGGAFRQAADLKVNCMRMIFHQMGELKQSKSTPNPSTQSQPHQLKRISLRTFDGKYSEWKQFSDLFQSLVGKDETIPPVQKLVRLKEALKGQAASLLATFTVTDENYEKAWQKLARKYEDPRVIAQALFNRILNLPKITKANEENLNANAASVLETMDQLLAMTGLEKKDLFEQMAVHLLRKSLDSETLRAWELKVGTSKEFTTLQEFANFVETCGRGINVGSKLHASIGHSQLTSSPAPQRKRSVHVAVTAQSEADSTRGAPRNSCAFCEEPHFIANCKKFTDLTPAQRNDVVVSKRLCFNCLGPHLVAKCKCVKTCFTCNRRHHTLIHGGSPYTMDPLPVETSGLERVIPPTVGASRATGSTESTTVSNNQVVKENSEILNKESSQQTVDQQYVLLATAQALAHSPKGYSLQTRILIDQGSEISFVTEHLVQQLQLQRRSSTLELTGIGGTNSGHTRGIVSIPLQAVNGLQQVLINAHILKKLTVKLPTFSLPLTRIEAIQGLQLADPQYLTPGPIDIIIGADSYGRIIESRVVKTKDTQLVGQQTIFGWILSGPLKLQSCSSTKKRRNHHKIESRLQRIKSELIRDISK
ncbi:uncharacterized protein [Fopius arisanus]|uniref:Peptidase aspartic putative domain-containing protein n=1 Tax=Fopius arisanus TaxID=64838 RepID=A0A9R1TJF7_9HYME|nr:PREDICTED: uncharacterized protein LOC105271702 [Fopius arisanus]